MKQNEYIETVPTTGYNSEIFVYRKTKFNIWV